MPQSSPFSPRSVWVAILTAGPAVRARAASPDSLAGMDHLLPEWAIISLLSFTVLLLAGVLTHLRKLRDALEGKTRALEKSERHIRLMGDNLPNVIIFQLETTKAGAFEFTYLSKGYERALGFDRGAASDDARQIFERIHEQDHAKLIEAYRRGHADMTPADLEVRAIDTEGQLKWLRVSAVPHFEQDVLVWDGFLQDISTNKQVRDALVEENKNFRNLFATIDDFLLVCDLDGRLLHSNPALEKRMEYSHEELTAMNIVELYGEAERKKVRDLVARMGSARSAASAFPLQTKSGGRIPVEINLFRGYWENGPALFGVARDIASRHRAETALRESQRMLQLIMDTIPMSVFWKDQDSVYLGCNQTFIRECGLESAADVVGKTPYDLFNAPYASETLERDQTVIRTNQPQFNTTQSHERPDGSIGWREINKIPLRDEEGRAVGVLGVWRDVTEQNRAEERLKGTLEDMERFNQLMRGRERRTLELKAEINDLLQQLGKTKKYRTTMEDIP